MKKVSMTLDGQEIFFCLTLGALEEICDEYGSLSEMQKQMKDDLSGKIRTVRVVCEILAKAGCELEGKPYKVGTIRNHARPADLGKLSECLGEAIRLGMETEISEDGERDGVLEDISKNALSGAAN